MKEIECNVCGKDGHYGSDCPEVYREERDKDKDQDEDLDYN